MIRKLMLALFGFALVAGSARAGELVSGVRYKLSAGDLPSGIAAVEDYRKTTGVDAEYLNAVGWLARGAFMLGRTDLAREYVAELRREIPKETPDLIIPLGAAIEVEGKILAAEKGRGAAIRFLEDELAHAGATPLRARIEKNINLLSLDGEQAPALNTADVVGTAPQPLASLKGKPVLLFFWYQGCGDCRGQSDSLTRIWQKYQPKGLVMIAPTRLYGTVDDKPATAAEEKARIAQVWRESYGGLADVPVVIDTETVVRYGVSATPTFALIDRKGRVRLYTPTRLSEAALSQAIDEVLAEAP